MNSSIAKFCKVTSVLYYILATITGFGLSLVLFIWVMADIMKLATSISTIVLVNVCFISLLIILLIYIFGLFVGGYLLWNPRRNDDFIYYAYQLASVAILLVNLCADILICCSGLIGILLDCLYFIVMISIPVMGIVGYGVKRRDAFSETNVYEQKLNVLQGEYAGASFPLCSDEKLIIGKSSKYSHIIINGNMISRAHCAVMYSQNYQMYYIKDLSTNGTFLYDGTRLPLNEWYCCSSGTIFMINNGEQIFQFL